MGAFDQFKDKADQVADQAKKAMGNKRDKSADADDSQDAASERGIQQEGQERGSDFEDRARDRLGSDSNDDQDNWA